MINNIKISYDNRGSALIMALVVSAVLMVLCFSVLALSYSFFLAQDKNSRGGTNERELFYSGIEAFEQELTNGLTIIQENKSTGKKEIVNNDKTKFANALFDDIYNYNLTKSSMKVKGWKCFDLDTYNGLSNDTQKSLYLNDSSKYYELTCFGAYNFKIQMYWEYCSYDINDYKDIDDEDFLETLKNDELNGIMLHAIYCLEKNESELIKSERTYRLKLSKQGNVNKNTEQVSNDPTKNCTIKFQLANKDKYKKDPDYNNVHPDFYAYDPDGIKVNRNDKEEIDFIGKGYYNWYTGSDMNNNQLWDYTAESIFKTNSNTPNERIARTKWDDMVPVRLKFIINGYYLNLDIFDYRYIRFTKYYTGEQKQVFTKFQVDACISDDLLSECGVILNETDNLDNIIWILKKSDGTYTNLFDNDGNPVIEKASEPFYYVYATFPSYYCLQVEDDIEQSADNVINISKLDPNKFPSYDENSGLIVEPELSCWGYSFERIIGE